MDGHDLAAVQAAFDNASQTGGKPSVIIVKAIEGKGISFMENVAGWHGKAPNSEELQQALAEIYGKEN